MAFDKSNKKSTQWGQGGITGGGNQYDQINIPGNFTVHPESGLNKHKPNVKTDKPYDSHINGKK